MYHLFDKLARNVQNEKELFCHFELMKTYTVINLSAFSNVSAQRGLIHC